jgi:hypothetical protein
MSNETCTVTIADIYGAEWWKRNKAELDREWEWGFGVYLSRQRYVARNSSHILVDDEGDVGSPRIILHRRKPKPPTLREVYGVDEVTITAGWEWTGEFKVPMQGERFQSGGSGTVANFVHTCAKPKWYQARLILRERPKKVWYKTDGVYRDPRKGDYYYDPNRITNR